MRLVDIGAIAAGQPQATGYAKWVAGAYTVALWDAQSLMSGNWTDSVSSITLTKGGSPTYQVSGNNGYEAWKGVSFNGSSDDFSKSAASSALDLGTNYFVVQAVISFTDASTEQTPFSDYGDNVGFFNNFICPYVIDSPTSTWRYNRVKADDGTGMAGGAEFIPVTNLPTGCYKIRMVGNRTSNLNFIENGVSIGAHDISNLSALAISNTGYAIGSRFGALYMNGTVFAVKIDISSDAAVLLVNDGGPGGG